MRLDRAAERDEERPERPPAPAPAPPAAAHAILTLQQGVGNAAVARHIQRLQADADADAAPAREEGEAPELAEEEQGEQTPEAVATPEAVTEQAAVAVGEGHHVTARIVDGTVQFGVASEFAQVANIAKALKNAPKGTLTQQQLERVDALASRVSGLEDRATKLLGRFNDAVEKEQELRELVTESRRAYSGGPFRRRRNPNHPKYSSYLDAIEKADNLKQSYGAAIAEAVSVAKDAILELWEIGKEFLPTHLMPVGAVFKDKAVFGGDTTKFTYHTGEQADPIPITWYKAPGDYPQLQLEDGTVKNFGDAFSAGGYSFQLATANVPKDGWMLQKTMHNESREGQHDYNVALNKAGVKVNRNGAWLAPPLSAAAGFDGDHVKDLGFGGADAATNYWPLDSRINRRAFNGYNAGYVVHFKDEKGELKSRAIGGLVGRWFVVKRFLATGDGPVPADGAAAGGTPK